MAWLVFGAALLAYHLAFGRFFLGERVGHDYAQFLPQLLEGRFWSRANPPWNVQWFSPGLCGGVPAFADPQSLSSSVAQWLTVWLPPMRAVYVTVLVFAAAAYGGMLRFLGRVLALPPGAAIAGALLFTFNGFFAARMLAGHFTFHAFALLPALACFATEPRHGRWSAELLPGIGGGLVLAYWLSSGLGVLVLPCVVACLGLVGLALAAGATPLRGLLLRWLVLAVVGGGLGAPKLVAVSSFLASFPRSHYAVPVFESALDALATLGRALFGRAPDWSEVAPHLERAQFPLHVHEWSFGITALPAVLLLGALVAWSVRALRIALRAAPATAGTLAAPPQTPFAEAPTATPPAGPLPEVAPPRRFGTRVVGWTLFGLGLGVPVALNLDLFPAWQELLKHVPVLRSSSSFVRWWSVDMVLVLAGSFAAAGRAGLFAGRWSLWLPPGAALAVALQVSTMDHAYFATQPYDPRPTTIAWEMARDESFSPRIERVWLPAPGAVRPGGPNDALAFGASSLACYFPLFGYRLESMPRKGLRPGSVDESDGAFFNLTNPACSVFPEENGCAPGDRFRVDQRQELEAFVRYEPFSFRVSRVQRLAGGGALLVGLSLPFAIGLGLWGRRRRPGAPTEARSDA